MTYLIPANLDINELLEKFPPRKRKNRKFNTGNLYYLIDLLCSETFDQFEEGMTDDAFVRLSSTLLNNHITKYKDSLNYLMDAGVVEANNAYVAGNIATSKNVARCKGYRFTEPYLREFKELNIEDSSLNRKKTQARQLSHRKQNEYRHLLKWFNPKLVIDVKAALEFNQMMYEDVRDDKARWKPKMIQHPWYGLIPSGEVVDPIYSYQSQQFAIRRFSEQEFTFSLSSSRRLYSTLGFLKKEFRQFVSYDGCRLVELDAGNCQPYLIQGLFNHLFWTNQHDHFNVKDIKQYHITNNYLKVLNSSCFSWFKLSTMLGNLAETVYRQGFQRYQHDVNKGIFYQTFYDNHSSSPGKDNLYEDEFFDGSTDEKAIASLKYRILKYVNASYRWNSPVKNGFKKDYPEVHELLMTLKKYDRNNDISTFMHAIEATIFLFLIAKRFAIEYADRPIYSIHDCLITTRGHEKILEEIMLEEFTKCIGIRPVIKTKYWFSD
ncbi:MAG: hypothetical protein ABI675_24320 [Chitinophagaceae bacterium]